VIAHPPSWRNYVIEGALLACFMVSASAFTILVEHPGSRLAQLITNPLLRRLIVGCAMSLTAIILIYSPWGKRTGAHMNPAVTLAMARLRPMSRRDVAGYLIGQFAGGVTGMALAALLFGAALSHDSINWIVTRPGPWGTAAAAAAECGMTMLMMTVVLWCANHLRWAPYTGIASAALLAAFITLEAPVSGMSLNPARTLGPALFAGDFTGLWIYFIAPPAGMAFAAAAQMRRCPGARCPHGMHGAHQ
jgi:aquaporin Z